MANTIIKLTFQVGTKKAQKSFNQNTVLLGSASEDLRGISIDISSMLPEHIRIYEQNGEFYAHNLANDPFVTLNDRPFGKKKLTNGDCIAVGEAEVFFEGEITTSLDHLNSSLDETMQRNQSTSLFDEDEGDLEAMIREIEELPTEEEIRHQEDTKLSRVGQEFLHQQFEATTRSIKTVRAAKTRRETPEVVKHHFNISEPPRPTYWRPFLAILMVIFAVAAAVGSGVYFTFSEKSDEQEFVASLGLADMAMVLTYSQLYQVKPTNQNWSDPDFVRDVLLKILPEDYPSLISIDRQGYFANCPYLLRVYTNADLSQFLLLAQPEPSLWQWLLARGTIILDSRTMELRRTTDIRALNRLLANTKPLEGANALEISHLVSQADLMRLTTLATETGHREFLPPKGLAKALPGAELRVYNAPRYYRISQPVTDAIGESISSDSPMTDEKAQELHRTVGNFSKLSQFVLYSSRLDNITQKIVRLLDGWFSSSSPVVAQLNLEPSTGRVLSSYIVELTPDTEVTRAYPTGDWSSLPEPQEVALNEEVKVEEHRVVETESGIKQELRTALLNRQNALLAYKQKIDQLLEAVIQAPQGDFAATVAEWAHEMEDVDIGQQVDIRQAIADTYRKYVLEDQAYTHLDYIAEAAGVGVEPFLPPEFLENQSDEQVNHAPEPKHEPSPIPLHDDMFVQVLDHIQHASDFELIEKAVSDANEELARDPNEDAKRLRMLRNKLQLQVVHRLDELILDPGSPLSSESYTLSNRIRIHNILANAGIEDEGIRDYYLREFELLVQQRTHSQNSE